MVDSAEECGESQKRGLIDCIEYECVEHLWDLEFFLYCNETHLTAILSCLCATISVFV
jgi:hypothetical protein